MEHSQVLPFGRSIARHFPVLIPSVCLFLPKAVRPVNGADWARHQLQIVTLGSTVCFRCFNYAMAASSEDKDPDELPLYPEGCTGLIGTVRVTGAVLNDEIASACKPCSLLSALWMAFNEKFQLCKVAMCLKLRGLHLRWLSWPGRYQRFCLNKPLTSTKRWARSVVWALGAPELVCCWMSDCSHDSRAPLRHWQIGIAAGSCLSLSEDVAINSLVDLAGVLLFGLM